MKAERARRIDEFVEDVPLLSLDECARVAAEVERLRPLWVKRRSESYAFYTLGAASYLDFDTYYEKAAALNQQMECSFGWLYRRLLEALGNCLQQKVALEPHAARPGFHIMLPTDQGMIPRGDLHFDVQFSRIDWADADRMDFSSPMSYTLAIRLPRSGGGLNHWSVTLPDFQAMDAAARRRLGLDQPAEYVPYREGNLVCHSGLLLHTNAASHANRRSDDVRLTLQGHALLCDDTYLLYW